MDNRVAAAALVDAFASRTGLDGDNDGDPLRRYLWTDAFATCTFLALADGDAGSRHGQLAQRLVDAVHRVLGRHRADDPRDGWISGLDDAGGAAHPTAGGLRIGKPLPERAPGEPMDERLEWERDGQYFHYLTRWMHALDQFDWRLGHPHAGRWARELAQAAQRGFMRVGPGGDARMAWKMDTALDRPLVASMGQHDPLDGLVTCLQLQAHRDGAPPDLQPQVDAFLPLAAGGRLVTTDPLGIGGLLVDAARLAQLPVDPDGEWIAALLRAAHAGLEAWDSARELERPPARRLAFRELGLSIGLHAVARLAAQPAADRPTCARALDALRRFEGVATTIESCWRDPQQQASPSWRDHQDINDVMLATSLLPDGYLRLRPAGPRPG